jgi:3-oxoacyl-[acyl-carrier-protein] synthase-3
MLSYSAALVSVGSSVPANIVTNDDLSRTLDTSDEWIVTRTGIRQRRIVDQPHALSATELGSKAARAALNKAGIDPLQIQAIICATFTPDSFFPSTACRVQHELGATNACAFDISAACSGFVYGLSVATAFIRAQQYQTVLLIGTEIISRAMDWTDRTTSILFGDAAGAAILTATTEPNKGVLATTLASNGALGDILSLPAWGEKRTMSMRGNEVFKHAVRLMSESALTTCSKAGLTLDDIDMVIPHQANMRIINGLAEKLQLAPEKVFTNLEKYGNTSAASIPLALDEAWQCGKVGPGSLVLFTALGGGITVGSALVRL